MPKYPEIIIIVGSGRSGTSYLQRTLRDTLDIGFFREPKYIIPVYQRLSRFGNLDNSENLQRLVKYILQDGIFEHLSTVKNIPSIYDELFPRISEPTYSGVLYAIFAYIAEKQEKSRLGYKFPSDITHLSELAEIFPTARFVHMMRDGRDVAISLLNQSWGAENLFAGSRFWSRQTRKGRADGRNLSDRYIEIRYENFIENSDEVALKLGEFLNRGQNIEQVQGFVTKVKDTKKVSSVYGWKATLSKEQVFLCEAAAGSELQACGYELEFDGKASISPLAAGYYISTDLFSRFFRNLRELSQQ